MNILFAFLALLFITAFTIAILFANRKQHEIITLSRYSAEVAAKVLNSGVKKGFSGGCTVKGQYKRREAIFDYFFDNSPTNRAQSFLAFCRVIHRGTPFKKLVMIKLPQPTKETVLENNMVWAMFDFRNIKTEQDVIAIFDKLTEAAEIVEQNKPYYSLGR